MSKPLPFARVPATRPSGFWMTLKTRMTWLRMSSNFGFTPYGVRRQLLDELHVRLDALVLVPVDGALDVDGDLDVVAPLVQEILRARGILERDAAELDPAVVVADLLRRVQRVEHDAVERAAEGRMADDLDAHAVAELRRLDVGERAADRVVGDVREAADRVGRATSRPAGCLPRPFSGVPHHGGVSWALALPTNPSDTVSAAKASRTSLRNLPGKCEHLLVETKGVFAPSASGVGARARQMRTTRKNAHASSRPYAAPPPSPHKPPGH